MVHINQAYTIVLPTISYGIYTLNIYEKKLGDYRYKITYQNLYRFFYRRGKCIIYRFYCEEFIGCVCTDVSGKEKSRMRSSDHKCMQFGNEE